MRLVNRIGLLMVLAAACACSQPSSREYFVRSDGSGEYSFELEMSDTLALYDISFYTRLDERQADTLAGFPMAIVWRSPSGRFFSESVWYPADKVLVPYRSGFRPPETGLWGLSVTLPDPHRRMRGLGVVCAKGGD